jgi:hypothetical protein
MSITLIISTSGLRQEKKGLVQAPVKDFPAKITTY